MQEIKNWYDIGVVVYVLIDELDIFAPWAFALEYADF